MKKVKILLTLAVLMFLAAGALTVGIFINKPQIIKEHAAAGTNLSISPSSQNIYPGGSASFTVNMDTGNNNVIGFDILLKFDPHTLQITSLEKGSDVTAMNNTINNTFDNSAGSLEYTIFTLDKSQAVKGQNLSVLKINASVLPSASSGNYNLTFDPATAVSATGENQNVLVSSAPAAFIVLNSTPVPTATATPLVTASPTTNPTGQPNSCGGTCGSNDNCAANLYCYQGYCRNPSCSWSGNCNCTDATASPSPVPTTSPKPTSSGTGTFKTSKPLATFTPAPTAKGMSPTPTPNNYWSDIFNSSQANMTPSPIPSFEPLNLQMSSTNSFLPWIVGSLIIAGVTLIFIVIGILKEAGIHRNKPPLIKV